MPAETNDTYPMTPPSRSVFSASDDTKGHPVNQTPKNNPNKIDIKPVGEKHQNTK